MTTSVPPPSAARQCPGNQAPSAIDDSANAQSTATIFHEPDDVPNWDLEPRAAPHAPAPRRRCAWRFPTYRPAAGGARSGSPAVPATARIWSAPAMRPRTAPYAADTAGLEAAGP